MELKLTRREETLLTYFEEQAVRRGGELQGAHLDDEDFAIAERWQAVGFVQFGPIIGRDFDPRNLDAYTHRCVLSELAWAHAHALRRAQGAYTMLSTAARRRLLLDRWASVRRAYNAARGASRCRLAEAA